jgi:multimeric flavodoxin WrbA
LRGAVMVMFHHTYSPAATPLAFPFLFPWETLATGPLRADRRKDDRTVKIVTVLGSPRKCGNTAAVLEAFERLASKRQHSIERINVVDWDVRGCLGCDTCFETLDAPGCAQDDDAAWILEHILDSDLVVYASPVYAWGFTGQLKPLIDRHYCLVKWQGDEVASALMTGKRAALLATCGGDAAGNADLLEEAFKRLLAYAQCQPAGIYVLDNCSSKPAGPGADAEDLAQRMARELLT